jgi:hypothetical protein
LINPDPFGLCRFGKFRSVALKQKQRMAKLSFPAGMAYAYLRKVSVKVRTGRTCAAPAMGLHNPLAVLGRI